MFRFLVITCVLLITGCPWHNDEKLAKVAVALYESSWSGSSRLEPENITYIASPSDAYIKSIGFGYGKEVKKGDNLIVLSDPKIQDDFTSSIIDYVKSKDKMQHEAKKLKGEQELLKAGILSADDFWVQKNAHQDSYISFIKSQIKLQEVCDLVGVKFQEIAQLNFSDLTKIQELLVNKVSVKVAVPKAGLLLPRNILEKDNVKPLSLGQKVAKGELLAVVADQGSYRVKVFLPGEFAQVIQKSVYARISSDLGLTLAASIKDYQPYLYEIKNGKRFFPAILTVVIPKPPLKVPDLYVGMPVFVKMVFGHDNYKILPISAVGYKDGQYYIEKKSMFKTTKVKIKVIGTDARNVFFTGDTEVGDKVVLHD